MCFPITRNLISGLAITDNLAVITETYVNIKKLFSITKRYIDKVGMVINLKKSAAAYRANSLFIPIVNGVSFKNLRNTICYKYLRIHINLDLN